MEFAKTPQALFQNPGTGSFPQRIRVIFPPKSAAPAPQLTQPDAGRGGLFPELGIKSTEPWLLSKGKKPPLDWTMPACLTDFPFLCENGQVRIWISTVHREAS